MTCPLNPTWNNRQGNGGYGLAQFSVTVPLASGGTHEAHGSIVTIYQRDPDGWHMRLVEPSVPEPGRKRSTVSHKPLDDLEPKAFVKMDAPFEIPARDADMLKIINHSSATES